MIPSCFNFQYYPVSDAVCSGCTFLFRWAEEIIVIPEINFFKTNLPYSSREDHVDYWIKPKHNC